MVFTYILFIIILTIPCVIFSCYTRNFDDVNAEVNARNRFIYAVASVFC